ncbi:BMP family ABC transporter substrate-binding protein [Mycoplasmopsis pullorum]|nr:BMP family ABC transporter substrate-binding protein [Mycoplasmopsis pullorum]TNK91658.1 BMP family ABC transporter substrate-binding protein [Mycoplasmopsis pullorum]
MLYVISLHRSPTHKKMKMALVTDEGNVDDKSFNQSAWESLNLIYDQTEIMPTYVKPSGNYETAYKAVINKGNKIIVLPGFKHKSAIAEYITENLDDLIEKKVHIIGIDFDIAEDINYPYFYSLQYKMKEAGYVVGFATAKFLGEKYSNDEAKRLANSFGGGPFPGVTDFNEGFLKGLYAYAEENPKTKVKHTPDIKLDSGFAAGDTMTNAVTTAVATKASVILPVAGPATGEVLTELGKAGSNSTYVIGVDVDQSLAYKDNAGKFLTSITKGIAQSTYDIVTEILFPEVAGTNFLKSKDANTKFAHSGSLKENWVGYVLSKITDEADRAKMDEALKAARVKFDALSDEDIEFINSGKALKSDNAPEEQIPVRLNKLINEIAKLS